MKKLILLLLLLAAAGYVFVAASKSVKSAAETRNAALSEVLN